MLLILFSPPLSMTPQKNNALSYSPTTRHRYFRLKRAMNLSLKYDYLPADQWTKPEEDVQELNGVIKQVRKEDAERDLWDNQNA